MSQITIKTSIQKYPTYKDSGVEWLGEIPVNWELTRLGTRFLERKTKVSDKDFPPLSVTKKGIVSQLDTAAKSNDGENRKLVKEGDFVINSRSDRKGSSGIAFEDGSVSLINIVMTPKEIYPTFCNYLLKSTAFVEENYRIGHGIVADLWTTRYDEMKNIKVAIPYKQEQTAIAHFLDDKTAKIDQAIAQKEQLIALLKERKQIIIQNSVTGKLVWSEKERKMIPLAQSEVEGKDSGVEWIGEIPEHWEVFKFKQLFREKKKEKKKKLNKNLPAGAISYGIVRYKPDNSILASTKETYQEVLVDEFLINPLNLNYDLVSLRIALSKIDVVVSSGYIVLKEKRKFHKKYMKWLLHRFDISQMKVLGSGVRQTINFNHLSNELLILPPIEEQKLIESWIEEKLSQVDSSISLQIKQIEKLKEYKSTLIDSAVTGKIKVPGI